MVISGIEVFFIDTGCVLKTLRHDHRVTNIKQIPLTFSIFPLTYFSVVTLSQINLYYGDVCGYSQHVHQYLHTIQYFVGLQ